MKIRNGFVSNSSSASFVIALVKEPVDVNDVVEMLNINESCLKMKKSLRSNIPPRFSVEQVAGIIYGQILNNHSNSYYIAQEPSDLIKMLRWSRGYDHIYTSSEKLCPKYTDDDCACMEKCPRFKTCTYNNSPTRLTFKDSVNRAIGEWECTRQAFDEVSKFIKNTFGYKYYYIECGCQTSFGELMHVKHEEIFKNIFYMPVDREY